MFQVEGVAWEAQREHLGGANHVNGLWQDRCPWLRLWTYMWLTVPFPTSLSPQLCPPWVLPVLVLSAREDFTPLGWAGHWAQARLCDCPSHTHAPGGLSFCQEERIPLPCQLLGWGELTGGGTGTTPSWATPNRGLGSIKVRGRGSKAASGPASS